MYNKTNWRVINNDLARLNSILIALSLNTYTLQKFSDFEKDLGEIKSYRVKNYFNLDPTAFAKAIDPVAPPAIFLKTNIPNPTTFDSQKPQSTTYEQFLMMSDQAILRYLNGMPSSETANLRSQYEKIVSLIAKKVNGLIEKDQNNKKEIHSAIFTLLDKYILPNISTVEMIVVQQLYCYSNFMKFIETELKKIGHSDDKNFADFQTNLFAFKTRLSFLDEIFPQHKQQLNSHNNNFTELALILHNRTQELCQHNRDLLLEIINLDWNVLYEQDPELTLSFLSFIKKFQARMAEYLKNIQIVNNFPTEDYKKLNPQFKPYEKFQKIPPTLNQNSNTPPQTRKNFFQNEKTWRENFKTLEMFVSDATLSLHQFILPSSNELIFKGNQPLISLIQLFNLLKTSHSYCFRDFIKSCLEHEHIKQEIKPFLSEIMIRIFIQSLDPTNAALDSKTALFTNIGKKTTNSAETDNNSYTFNYTELFNFSDLEILATAYNFNPQMVSFNSSEFNFANFFNFVSKINGFVQKVFNNPNWQLLQSLISSLAIITRTIFETYSYIYFGINHCRAFVGKYLSPSDKLNDFSAALKEIMGRHEILPPKPEVLELAVLSETLLKQAGQLAAKLAGEIRNDETEKDIATLEDIIKALSNENLELFGINPRQDSTGADLLPNNKLNNLSATIKEIMDRHKISLPEDIVIDTIIKPLLKQARQLETKLAEKIRNDEIEKDIATLKGIIMAVSNENSDLYYAAHFDAKSKVFAEGYDMLSSICSMDRTHISELNKQAVDLIMQLKEVNPFVINLASIKNKLKEGQTEIDKLEEKLKTIDWSENTKSIIPIINLFIANYLQPLWQNIRLLCSTSIDPETNQAASGKFFIEFFNSSVPQRAALNSPFFSRRKASPTVGRIAIAMVKKRNLSSMQVNFTAEEIKNQHPFQSELTFYVFFTVTQEYKEEELLNEDYLKKHGEFIMKILENFNNSETEVELRLKNVATTKAISPPSTLAFAVLKCKDKKLLLNRTFALSNTFKEFGVEAKVSAITNMVLLTSKESKLKDNSGMGRALNSSLTALLKETVEEAISKAKLHKFTTTYTPNENLQLVFEVENEEYGSQLMEYLNDNFSNAPSLNLRKKILI